MKIMSLWDKITSLFKTTEEPAEELRRPGALFREICHSADVGDRLLNSANLVEEFEKWYTGPCDEASVRDSIKEFMIACPAANAKLQGRL